MHPSQSLGFSLMDFSFRCVSSANRLSAPLKTRNPQQSRLSLEWPSSAELRAPSPFFRTWAWGFTPVRCRKRLQELFPCSCGPVLISSLFLSLHHITILHWLARSRLCKSQEQASRCCSPQSCSDVRNAFKYIHKNDSE